MRRIRLKGKGVLVIVVQSDPREIAPDAMAHKTLKAFRADGNLILERGER
jgi:hypothetical protein